LIDYEIRVPNNTSTPTTKLGPTIA
jgi:hypothetical protein